MQDIQKLLHAAETFEPSCSTWSEMKGLGLVYRGLQSHCKPTCGKILSHSKRQVAGFREMMGISLLVFKIGVTVNPPARFVDYVRKGFTQMWVIFQGNDVGTVHMLEAALISEFSSACGCRNMQGTGGEGALNRKNSGGPPFFVYITGGRADQSRRVG